MAHPLLNGIYAILDLAAGDEPRSQVAAMLAGGARLVQYRAKGGVNRVVLRRLRAEVAAAGGIVIVNDDCDALADADGVHLGQEDLARVDVRALRAEHPRKLLGISCPDVSTALAAQAFGADYVGAGAMYATASKGDAGPPIGAAGVRAVVEAVSIPVAAIGGITLARIPEVRATGAAMAAVITAISGAADRTAATRALVAAWTR